MRGFIRSAALIAACTLAATACGEDTSTSTAAPAAAVQTSPSSEAPIETSPSSEVPVGDMGHEDMGHEDVIEAPAGAIPTVSIDVIADAVGGYNVTIETTSFVVRPDLASTEHVEGSGHYHLWIDGEKTLRFYNDAIHVALAPGMHEIGVELSANTHASYAVDGEVIAATAMVEVPGELHDADHQAGHDAGHDDAEDDDDHEVHGHDHAAEVDVSGIASAPSLELTVHDDPKAGYNVEIDVQNLMLSAEHASGDHVLGEGHLHLYVDGDKVGRLYGGWTHIGLDEGDHVVEVRAFTNDHRAYVIDGVPIAAAETITVPAG